MASSLALNITIGAALAGAFSKSFGIAENSIAKIGGALDEVRRKSADLEKVLKANEALGAARQAGSSAEELEKLGRAYDKAAEAAGKYGKTIGEWIREQERASRQISLLEQRMGVETAREAERQKRRKLATGFVVDAAMAKVMSSPVRDAISFETAMADAAKTIDGMRDDTGKLTEKYHEMGRAVQEMGRSIPLTHAEIAALFAAGGQQGLTDVKQLQKFATMAAHMSVAWLSS